MSVRISLWHLVVEEFLIFMINPFALLYNSNWGVSFPLTHMWQTILIILWNTQSHTCTCTPCMKALRGPWIHIAWFVARCVSVFVECVPLSQTLYVINLQRPCQVSTIMDKWIMAMRGSDSVECEMDVHELDVSCVCYRPCSIKKDMEIVEPVSSQHYTPIPKAPNRSGSFRSKTSRLKPAILVRNHMNYYQLA
jgi:hypothetical protein